MSQLKNEAQVHFLGFCSAVGASVFFSIVHFSLPFVLKTHALLYDLLFELLLTTTTIFVLTAIIRLSEFKPLTHIVWFALTVSAGSLYVVAVPTVIDRSLSIYILSKLELHQAVTAEELGRSVQQDYFADYDVIPTRLEEQQISGNVASVNGSLAITVQGSRIVALTTWYKKLLDSKYD